MTRVLKWQTELHSVTFPILVHLFIDLLTRGYAEQGAREYESKYGRLAWQARDCSTRNVFQAPGRWRKTIYISFVFPRRTSYFPADGPPAARLMDQHGREHAAHHASEIAQLKTVRLPDHLARSEIVDVFRSVADECAC